jgi:hypothetical protein
MPSDASSCSATVPGLGECKLNHRRRRGFHRSTGDEAHNFSSTDKRLGITQRGKVDIPTLADMSASDPRHSPSETKPATSETLLILTLYEFRTINLFWHMRCSDRPA